MGEVLVKIQPPDHPVHMPEPATFSAEVEAEIDRHLAKYPVKRSAILPLMFIVQRERGYLDPPGVQYLANRLQLRVTDIGSRDLLLDDPDKTDGPVSHPGL